MSDDKMVERFGVELAITICVEKVVEIFGGDCGAMKVATKVASNGANSGFPKWRLRWGVVGALLLLVSHPLTLSAQDSIDSVSTMRVRVAYGGWIVGRLASSMVDGSIALESRWFSDPIELAADQVLECLPADEGPLLSVSSSGLPSKNGEFAFLLANGDRYVGELLEWRDRQVTVSTRALGRVEFEAGQLVEMFDRTLLEPRLFSLERAPWRWSVDQPRDGDWKLDRSRLVCTGARKAIVGRLDLPVAFRIRLEVTCDGTPDFELVLGDRHEDVLENLSRRGGSRPQLPGERFVTKLEWFDESVSLVRSNGSVSDSSVFSNPASRLSNEPVEDSVSTSIKRLEVDVFVDQLKGGMAAYCDGRLMGRVNLSDAEPVTRESLTLMNRGDALQVRRLELNQWDGVFPASERPLVNAARLKDGTLVSGVTDVQLIDGRFQLGDESVSLDRIERLRTNVSQKTNRAVISNRAVIHNGAVIHNRAGQGTVEILMTDGCRISGVMLRGGLESGGEESAGPDASQAILLHLRLDSGTRHSILAGDIRRIIGAARRVESQSIGTQFQSEGVSLTGRLVSDQHNTGGFGWRAVVAKNTVGIVESTGASVTRIQDSVSANEGLAVLHLQSGDRVAGRVLLIDGKGVEVQTQVAGRVIVPNRSMKVLELIQPLASVKQSVDASAIAKLLVVPRRSEDDPPTHVIIAANGDALRGRLISLGDSEANFELRSKTRVIQRRKVAKIVWLSDLSADSDLAPHWVFTENGDRLGLRHSRFDGSSVSGQHAVLGKCRIAKGTLSRLRFGERDEKLDDAWRLVPAKQPRSFEEPLE